MTVLEVMKSNSEMRLLTVKRKPNQNAAIV